MIKFKSKDIYLGGRNIYKLAQMSSKHGNKGLHFIVVWFH